MALVRKVKPGDTLKLPGGGYVKNKSSMTVSLAYLTEEELKQESPITDDKTQNEVKNNEHKQVIK